MLIVIILILFIRKKIDKFTFVVVGKLILKGEHDIPENKFVKIKFLDWINQEIIQYLTPLQKIKK
jgi:hypothetical protein